MTVAARSSTTEQIHQLRVDSHAWTRVNEGCPGPPICCDPDREDRVLSWPLWFLGFSLALSAHSSRLHRGWPRGYPGSLPHSPLLVNLTAPCPTSRCARQPTRIRRAVVLG